MNCHEAQNLMDAMVDGELSREDFNTMHDHLAQCPACRREKEQLQTLSKRLKDISRPSVPNGLEKRIVSAIGLSNPTPSLNKRRRDWTSSAMSHVAAMAFGIVGTSLYLTHVPQTLFNANAYTSAHINGLMHDNLVEVASNDRHTVAPWFSGKVPFAPPVNDMSAHGFQLLGGRVQKINSQGIAVVLYKMRKHVISIFVMLNKNNSGLTLSTQSQPIRDRGFNLLTWQADGLQFLAISDLNSQDLGKLKTHMSSQKY